MTRSALVIAPRQRLTSGKPTRETAAALFLSPKTVEYHLRHIYQRLGIHSREELAERLGRHGDGAST
jgi:DNA-binding CsgD family transcriptional regulator